ncbi:MAG: AAA family ATPase [Bacteroidia bacterium]|nr:AAA family ATPase [Bacteroidia bacterium]
MSHPVPAWVQELARQYYAGRTALFVLHGNVYDFVWYEGRALPMSEFLRGPLFKRRDLVFTYNRATGITPRNDSSRHDIELFLRNASLGISLSTRDPGVIFPALHSYFHARLAEGRRIAFIIEHGETLIPAGGTYLSAEEKIVLLYLLQWAQSSLFLRSDMTILLLAESLNELHPRLVSNPHVSALRVPYPNPTERRSLIQHLLSSHPTLTEKLPPTATVESLTMGLGGLTLVQIMKLFAEIQNAEQPWDESKLLERKKTLVEAQIGGLIEFLPTNTTLDAVAGHHAAKAYLRAVAKALREGHTDIIPMGFLITGSVGTGKSFLIRSFAGEIGIPMVQIRNFRSKWVGETEANLERILALLEALAPIAVFVDEADTQLGGREVEGDSGVSTRVFGRLAAFMSEPGHRGRILWFLATARPDLLPPDIKRQGRAEEHIPLFPPTTPAEKKEVLSTLMRRMGLDPSVLPSSEESFWESLPHLSGAEWEAVLTRARFQARLAGEAGLSPDRLQEALQDYLPSIRPEEVEYMTYLAILECTRRSLLPPMYQQLSREVLLRRVEELRRNL